jgi:hypothetical protein
MIHGFNVLTPTQQYNLLNKKIPAALEIVRKYREYLMLLYSSAANMLSFEGYTTKSIYEAIQGQKQRNLTGY